MQMHLVLRMRAKAYVNLGRMQQAKEDLEQALQIARTCEGVKLDDIQLIENDLALTLRQEQDYSTLNDIKGENSDNASQLSKKHTRGNNFSKHSKMVSE